MDSTDTPQGFLWKMRYTPEQREAMFEQARQLDEDGNILLEMAFKIRMEINKYDEGVQS